MVLERLKKAYADWKREDAYHAEIEANMDPLYRPDPEALRLYVVVDTEILPPINQGIQATHAVVELLADLNGEYPGSFSDAELSWAEFYKTLIVLGATNHEMHGLVEKAQLAGVDFATFFEPDLGFRTAIAFEPMRKEEGDRLFRGLELAA